MGGKSRKSGGVSKKLIAALKSGEYGKPKCGSTKAGKNDKGKTTSKSIFDMDEETQSPS
jgi:hypothetical protein